jgi:hypothetical protein
VGFKPTIPAFKRAKTVHASEHTATVIGLVSQDGLKFKHLKKSKHPKFSRNFLHIFELSHLRWRWAQG